MIPQVIVLLLSQLVSESFKADPRRHKKIIEKRNEKLTWDGKFNVCHRVLRWNARLFFVCHPFSIRQICQGVFIYIFHWGTDWSWGKWKMNLSFFRQFFFCVAKCFSGFLVVPGSSFNSNVEKFSRISLKIKFNRFRFWFERRITQKLIFIILQESANQVLIYLWV
jgi:hypothetical protein